MIQLKFVCIFILYSITSSNASEYNLYLCIGQSNMAGRGKITSKEEGKIKNCFILNDKKKWEPAQSPLNQYSTVRKEAKKQELGPIHSFAKIITKKFNNKIGLVVNARGGTKIQEWQPDQQLYKETIERCKIAQQSGKFKAILWHQGEGNRNYSKYQQELTTLVEALRKDLGNPELPIIVGEIAGEAAVNQQLAKFVREVSNTALVSAKNLTLKDKSHFDTEGQLELGKRYAEALINLNAKNK